MSATLKYWPRLTLSSFIAPVSCPTCYSTGQNYGHRQLEPVVRGGASPRGCTLYLTSRALPSYHPHSRQAWWSPPPIPTPGSLRQEEYKHKVSMGYTVTVYLFFFKYIIWSVSVLKKNGNFPPWTALQLQETETQIQFHMKPASQNLFRTWESVQNLVDDAIRDISIKQVSSITFNSHYWRKKSISFIQIITSESTGNLTLPQNGSLFQCITTIPKYLWLGII